MADGAGRVGGPAARRRDIRELPRRMKVAIITGASQGIGIGLVAGFRGAGYAVVGNSRSIGSVEEPDYVTVAGDIAEARTAHALVDRALERFGQVDSLINNAGIFIGKPFTHYTAED